MEVTGEGEKIYAAKAVTRSLCYNDLLEVMRRASNVMKGIENTQSGRSAPGFEDAPRPCSALFGSFNFAYSILFLRNAGERIRAIRLAMDALGIGFKEAREWVDSVHIRSVKEDRSAARAMFAENPCDKEEVEDGFELRVSHWPND